ncbi:MAG TPA: transporter substrate-binding domain-containing protein [Burkholderiales bacterium]|jgi:polar amino acid transport system substrate-binding protein|nr:transporter substrate-binding domain-containing protein [Burkholderiales bacterium]
MSTRILLWLSTAALLLAAPLLHARTLEEIKARGTISVCANPDALPYAANRPDEPGFQLELARKIAEGLGVGLTTEWIVARRRISQVNCDMLLDSVNDPAVYEGRLLLSRPYHRTGVALGLRGDASAVLGFDDLRDGRKVGVMVGSLASVVLGKKGIRTSPYAFEQDMIEDLLRGALDAVAVNPATFAYHAARRPDAGLRLVHAYETTPELSWQVSVALRNADEALRGEVDRVLERLLAEGTLAQIYTRYHVEHRVP